jgi:hypothetical protein
MEKGLDYIRDQVEEKEGRPVVSRESRDVSEIPWTESVSDLGSETRSGALETRGLNSKEMFDAARLPGVSACQGVL